MARYVYSASDRDGRCIGYLESTDEEERLDMVGDQIAVRFTGNGYLAFWRRCREFERALGGDRFSSEIDDTYTGESKSW